MKIITSLINSLLCIAASLLMTECNVEHHYWYRCTMEIYNDTDYPVALHMNFDPQNGSMYTFGEIRYIISEDSLLGLIEHRYLNMEEKNYPVFDNIWETPDNETIYCKLYRVNPDTYKEEELLAEWNSSQSDESSLFNAKSWREDWHFDYTNMVGIYEWKFYINEHLTPTLNE